MKWVNALRLAVKNFSENTHTWLQFVVNILVWNIRKGSCLKGIKITIQKHINTNIHTRSRKGSQLQKLLKKRIDDICLGT